MRNPGEIFPPRKVLFSNKSYVIAVPASITETVRPGACIDAPINPAIRSLPNVRGVLYPIFIGIGVSASNRLPNVLDKPL